MRLRDVKNIKRPYERQERFLQTSASQLLQILESEQPEDVKLAYANLNSHDPAWRKWSEETIAAYQQIRANALQTYDMCSDKLGQCDKYTSTFHLQIAICVVAVGFFLMAVIAR